MSSRRKAGAPAIAAAFLLGAAGLGGCTLIENGNGREAFREAVENSFYDPAYESIFTDPPPEFDSFGGDTGIAGTKGSGMNGFGEPAPYPDGRGGESLPDAAPLPPGGDSGGNLENGVYQDDLSTP